MSENPKSSSCVSTTQYCSGRELLAVSIKGLVREHGVLLRTESCLSTFGKAPCTLSLLCNLHSIVWARSRSRAKDLRLLVVLN